MKTLLSIISVLGLSILTSIATAQEIQLITENAPPNSYIEDGQLTGKSVDIIRAVLKEIGMENHKIDVYPWARGYKIIQNNKNTALFATARTSLRESQFKWAGPISDNDVYLYKLKVRDDIEIKETKDLSNYVVGAARNDQKAEYLASIGIKYEQVNKDIQNLNKLYSGRIDIIPYADSRIRYDIKASGLDPNKIEKIWRLNEASTQVYMAFSKSTDDTVVDLFQQGFDAISRKGIQDQLIKKWDGRK